MERLVKQAAEAYNHQNYERALELYKAAADKLGSNFFAVNIAQCEKFIQSPTAIPHFPPKHVAHPNDYFDCIYLVNLKGERAKRIKSLCHLKKLGIKVRLFDATNGYEGEPLKVFEEYKRRPIGNLTRYPEWNWREVKRNSHFIESPGAVGYIFTYSSIIRDAKQNRYKRIWIIEDDVLLTNDFFKKFDRFITRVDSDWKVLQLGASQYGWDYIDESKAIKDGFYFPKQLDTCGSFSIALNETIYDQLLEAINAFDAPFDHLPLGEIYEKYSGKCFVAFPNLSMADVSDSTIRGKRDQYKQASLVKWRVEDFSYPARRPSIAVILQSFDSLKYLNSFSNPEDLPFELHLYYPSSDGLRPIHLNGDFRSDLFQIVDLNLMETSVELEECDYVVTLDKDTCLTEDLIIQFIESDLGICSSKPTSFKSVTFKARHFVKGRASVILPTYKRPTNLKIAASSALTQNYSDFELIIVNDSGLDSEYLDETRKVVSELKSAHPSKNIVYIEHTVNRNGAAARNTGFMHSSGEFIMFLDDDDAYLPDRISKSVEALSLATKIEGAVYCGFLGWNSPENDENRYATGDLTKEILLLDYKKHYLHTNTATYRREAVRMLNGFDESYRRHQDLEFNLRFFRYYKTTIVKEALVRLNPEPSNISNKVFNSNMLELKTKFLNQFEYVIQEHADNMFDIYNIHWSEVVRYINDLEDFKTYAKSKVSSGMTQVLLRIMDNHS